MVKMYTSGWKNDEGYLEMLLILDAYLNLNDSACKASKNDCTHGISSRLYVSLTTEY